MRDSTSAQLALSLAKLVVTAAFAMLLLGMSSAAEQSAERPLTSAPAPADNYYAAGSRVQITEPMAGDIIVAGREIDVGQPVAGDILAAGWRVVLSARADDDVRIAGGEININAPVAGDVTVAGGDVTFGPQTRVTGRSWITGRTVRIDGIFDRDVRVAGATVEIAGEIRKPLQVIAEKFEILPSARILAPLTYKGPTEVRMAEGAVVNGPITYDRIPQHEARRARAFPAASTLLFSIHLFVSGLLVMIVLPRAETLVVGTLRSQPGKSLVAGLVFLVTTPVAAMLLIVSILGLPIGLVLGALYAVALFSGVVATAFFVGDFEARLLKIGPMANRGQRVLWLLAGVLTLALLRAMLGGMIVFVSVLFGMGALMLAAYHAYLRGPAPATT